MWSRVWRAFSACCPQLKVLVLGSLSFLTTKEHPDMLFSHNLIWKVNDSDDLLMTQINKPRESWHHYSLRRLSEVKWQYHSSQSVPKERDTFCFNCMSGLCCELYWLVMPVTTCFVHRFSVPLFWLKLTTVYTYLKKTEQNKLTK